MILLLWIFLGVLSAPGTALSHVSPTSRVWQPDKGGDRQLDLHTEDEEGHPGDCATLTNVQGTHYIISVLVGTPPQKFKLIPDTGSPWVIIANSNCSVCSCGKHGENYCFKESDSKTLKIPVDSTGHTESHQLHFGSGPISITVATDEVRIAGTSYHHLMDSGVLMMVDNGLTFSGPFEGLLGLALPEYKLDASVTTGMSQHTYKDGFLHRAGISSFSVCLSDKGWMGSGGVLRFNANHGEKTIGITSNTMHWQVAYYGVTVGKAQEPLKFCDKVSSGDQSPCAAIIDSGTTYILGPYYQIYSMFDGLCDQWDRCSNKFNQLLKSAKAVKELLKGKNNTKAVQPDSMTKSQIFQILLNDCNGWLKKPSGLQEMPSLKFTVKGRDGQEESLVVDPWDYIVTEKGTKMEIAYGKLESYSYATGLERKSKNMWICTPAFATMDFPTHGNGPAWIFGLPFFYSHVVSYNSDTTPPSMSFTRGKCGGCKSARAMPISNKTSMQFPRKILGEPRLPAQAKKLKL